MDNQNPDESLANVLYGVQSLNQKLVNLLKHVENAIITYILL